jgi:hypothetical protein
MAHIPNLSVLACQSFPWHALLTTQSGCHCERDSKVAEIGAVKQRLTKIGCVAYAERSNELDRCQYLDSVSLKEGADVEEERLRFEPMFGEGTSNRAWQLEQHVMLSTPKKDTSFNNEG